MSWADVLRGAPDAVLSLRADSVTLSIGQGPQARHHRVPIDSADTAHGADRAVAGATTAAASDATRLRSALATLVAQALAPTAGAASAGAGRRWRVLLAPPWLQLQALPWSAALLDAAGARAYALAALAQQGVQAAADDLVAIDPVPPLDAPRSLARVAGEVLSALQDASRTAGARLHSLHALPLLAATWCARQAGAGGRAGIWLDGSLLLLALPAGRPLPLHSARPVDVAPDGRPEAPADTLAALLRRSALQVPALAAPVAVPVLDLQRRTTVLGPAPAPSSAPDAPWPQLLPWPAAIDTPAALDLHLATQSGPGFDLLPAAAAHLIDVRTPWRRGALAQRLPRPWAWAGALLAGAGAAVLLADALAPAAPRQPAALATAPAPTDALPPRTDWAAAQQAVALIDLPIAPLLRALAPPASLPVSLVALDLSRRETASTRAATDSGSALLRLTAEAPSVQDMAAYADLLAGRRGMQAVQLVRHQQATQAGLAQRFVLELQWQP